MAHQINDANITVKIIGHHETFHKGSSLVLRAVVMETGFIGRMRYDFLTKNGFCLRDYFSDVDPKIPVVLDVTTATLAEDGSHLCIWEGEMRGYRNGIPIRVLNTTRHTVYRDITRAATQFYQGMICGYHVMKTPEAVYL